MDPIELATVQRSLTAPPANDPRKPRWPWSLSRRAWSYALRRTPTSLVHHDGFDSAAGLTFFSVLSLFPALLALLATLSLFGYGERAVAVLLGMLGRFAPDAVTQLVSEPISALTSVAGAGWVFAGSIAIALWSASGYVAAVGRALNRIYGVVEGRPLWAIIPYHLALTVVMLLFGAFALVAVALSADAAALVASSLGLPAGWLTGLQTTRWPYLVGAGLIVVVGLYDATPNVRPPHLGWTLVGGVVAVAFMLLAFLGFSWWLSVFTMVPATYGVIGSFIILLLGLYLVNIAVLVGAELNAELERARELAIGMHAEDDILLPPRRTRMIHARARRQSALMREAIALRIDHMMHIGRFARPDAAGPDAPEPDADPPAASAPDEPPPDA